MEQQYPTPTNMKQRVVFVPLFYLCVIAWPSVHCYIFVHVFGELWLPSDWAINSNVLFSVTAHAFTQEEHHMPHSQPSCVKE